MAGPPLARFRVPEHMMLAGLLQLFLRSQRTPTVGAATTSVELPLAVLATLVVAASTVLPLTVLATAVACFILAGGFESRHY